MPVSRYRSTLAAEETDGGGTLVVWSSDFDVEGATEDEAVAMIGGFLRAGLEAVPGTVH